MLCQACAPPREVDAAAQSVVPAPRSRQVRDSGLSTAELCFNGWDDNANGLIDEGCGVAQSELQVVLAWTDARADLDLIVRDPSGGIARAGDATPAGMTLSADCPESETGCVEQSFENAYLEADEVPAGRYLVRARLQKLPFGEQSVSATLGIRRPSATLSYELEFFAVGQEVLLDFAVSKRSGQADAAGITAPGAKDPAAHTSQTQAPLAKSTAERQSRTRRPVTPTPLQGPASKELQ